MEKIDARKLSLENLELLRHQAIRLLKQDRKQVEVAGNIRCTFTPQMKCDFVNGHICLTILLFFHKYRRSVQFINRYNISGFCVNLSKL